MATIIDSLLVKLGLDSSEFDARKNRVDRGLKNTGNEADKTGAKFKKAGKDGADGFANVAASAAKFLALVGGTMAVKRFIEQTVESSAALDRLSKNLQENVSTVSAWSNSAELAGGSAEGLQGTLEMLSKSQTELQLTGQSQLIPYFSALGVSIANASGKARSGNDILLDLSDRFSKMDRTTANNMGRMMGIDQGTMNLLLKGRKEVELMVARQKDYGALTLFTQLFYRVTLVHVVSPKCFYPAPDVESAVVVLDRREPRTKLKPDAPFKPLVRSAFSQRRKMMRKLLLQSGELKVDSMRVDVAFEKLGIAPKARGEELSLETFVELANQLS